MAVVNLLKMTSFSAQQTTVTAEVTCLWFVSVTLSASQML